MYGGSGKHGRGGGGTVRRNIYPTPINRPSTAPGGGRLPVGGAGGPRNRNTTSTAVASAANETFSLVTGNPLNFAMIIRLTPDLVDEIKRAESHGGPTRIKFDANANNTSGNVIDVGGKDFRFTWSREMGDLCDIYEERRSGEDGNGLLVESGCAWRKLNVQRVLDETTQNNLKMRSEEAERKTKSRKSLSEFTSRSSNQVQCQYCGKYNHTTNKCFFLVSFPTQPKSYAQSSNSPQALLASTKPTGFMWLADTGATNHTTPDPHVLHNPTHYIVSDEVQLGDGKTLKITHKGDNCQGVSMVRF